MASTDTAKQSPEVGTIDMQPVILAVSEVLQEITTRLPGREWDD
jgi:hypothetical protein